MPPKKAAKKEKPQPPPPEPPPVVEEPPAEEPVPVEEEKRPILWVHGVNESVEVPAALPADFLPTGILVEDFRNLCKAVGVVPHPSMKEKKKIEPEKLDQQSQETPVQQDEAPAPPPAGPPEPSQAEMPAAPEATPVPPPPPPRLAFRSVLLDVANMKVLSLLLPYASTLKVLCFSDCRLDLELLGLLRAGLQGDCFVESLQVEWNPFHLPPQEIIAGDATVPPSAECPTAEEAQSQRMLQCFREHLEALCGGDADLVWSRLAADSCELDKPLDSGDFVSLLVEKMGVRGPEAKEVFDILNGPAVLSKDTLAARSSTTLGELRRALEALPEDSYEPDLEDPIGLPISAFLDAECVLESLSLRACSISRLELGPIGAALRKSPWQLRCLNLWDNCICDRGAAILGAAFESYRGLEYIGLGKNRITEAGMASLVEFFQNEVMDAARYKQVMDEKFPPDPKAKGKAKAKAKAPAAPAAPGKDGKDGRRNSGVPKSGRPPKREAPKLTEEFEEVPGDTVTYIWKRYSELRTLALADNPICGADALEVLEPKGPRKAELVLRGTPAAAELLAKKPELRSLTRPEEPEEGWLLVLA